MKKAVSIIAITALVACGVSLFSSAQAQSNIGRLTLGKMDALQASTTLRIVKSHTGGKH